MTPNTPSRLSLLVAATGTALCLSPVGCASVDNGSADLGRPKLTDMRVSRDLRSAPDLVVSAPDLASPTDAAAPTDDAGAGDMAAPGMDDMGTPAATDMAGDMAGVKHDMAKAMGDMRRAPGDMAGPPADLAGQLPGCHVIINEVQTGSTTSASEEFVELFNPCPTPFQLLNWKLAYRSAGNNAGAADTTLHNIAVMTTIAAGGYVVYCGTTFSCTFCPLRSTETSID